MQPPIGYVAIDSEGDAGERGLQGVAFYGENLAVYDESKDAIVERLWSLYDKGFDFVAHNAEYDISVIFWQLQIPVTIVTYQGRFHHGEWKRNDDARKALIWDSWVLAGYASIKSLGEALGKPKYETPQRLLGIDADRYKWKCDKHEIWECEQCYAIRDAEICYDYFSSYRTLLADYGVQPKHTLASAAVALWKVWDKPGEIGIHSRRMAELARLAYHGGRTEVFIYGNIAPLYAADVDSMYPSIMYEMPMCYPGTLHYLEGKGIRPSVIDFEGVSEVYIYVPPCHVPPLGVEIDDRYIFPVGYIRGAWPHCELRAAVQRGARIERIFRTVYSEKVVSPFITFIDVLHALKRDFKAKGDVRYEVVKRLLNSLYGRMGLSGEQEKRVVRPVGANDTPISINGWDIHVGKGQVMLSRLTVMHRLPKDANVLWAANITGYARVRLLEYMELQGNALVYCDTDSVFSRQPINGLGEGLGKLTDEGIWDESLFIAPKLYRMMSVKRGEKVRAKGIPKEVAKQYLEHGEATFSRPWRIGESLLSGDAVGSWHEVTKRSQLQPGKRHVIEPDWRARNSYSETEPLSLEPVDSEDEETGNAFAFTAAYAL